MDSLRPTVRFLTRLVHQSTLPPKTAQSKSSALTQERKRASSRATKTPSLISPSTPNAKAFLFQLVLIVPSAFGNELNNNKLSYSMFLLHCL